MSCLFYSSSPSQQTPRKRWQRKAAGALMLLCGVGVCGFIPTGCNKGTYTVGPTTGLPPATSPSSSNAYVGTQMPLNWTLSVDDKQNAYSYQSIPTDSSSPATASGTFIPESGFLNMGAGGLALEIPGAGAILRPGPNTVAPVVMVEQEGCLALTGNQRYLLQGMVNTGAALNAIYRRSDIVASTTPDGKTWSFTNAEYFDGKGNQISLTYQGADSASTSTGTCTAANGRSSVIMDTTGAYHVPTTFRFEAAGLAVADYTSSTSVTDVTPAAAMGFAQPVNPVDAKSLAAASFRGFQVEYSSKAITQPISFGPATDGSVALNGGIYPNDDVTQTADSSDLFQFGSLSTSINGLFASATMTVLDPVGGCATNGVSAADLGMSPDGVATCRLHLSAMVGQVGGKAMLVASGFDFTVPGSSSPEIQFYLIQQ